MNTTIRSLGVVAVCGLTGCFWSTPGYDGPEETSARPAEPQPARIPPQIESITVPSWPPIGPTGAVRVAVRDSRAQGNVTAIFSKVASRSFDQSAQEVSFGGSDLGEGLGLLRIQAIARDGTRVEKRVENLLVDLTPPEVEVERPAVARNGEGFAGEVAFVARDQWVLGSLEVTFMGKTLRHEMPSVYPATLGKTWDVSRIAFPARDLPEGRGNATIVAVDAAGNRMLKSIPLRIDGTKPTSEIVSPAPGTVVSAPFDVLLRASDDDATVASKIDVRIGGAPAVVLLGPQAVLRVDPTTLPRGPLAIEAIAIDEAGNRGDPVTLTVEVE